METKEIVFIVLISVILLLCIICILACIIEDFIYKKYMKKYSEYFKMQERHKKCYNDRIQTYLNDKFDIKLKIDNLINEQKYLTKEKLKQNRAKLTDLKQQLKITQDTLDDSIKEYIPRIEKEYNNYWNNFYSTIAGTKEAYKLKKWLKHYGYDWYKETFNLGE